MEQDLGLILWSRFIEFINLRFGPPILSNSQRTQSLAAHRFVDYQRGFLALLSHCEELTTQHKIDLFTGGLG